MNKSPCRVPVGSPAGRTGFTLLELLVVIALVGVIVGLSLAGVQRSRLSAARLMCQNNLRQLGVAMHSYHAAAGRLPAGLSVSDGIARGPAFLGWQAQLLPHIEQQPLWFRVGHAFATDPNPLSFHGHPAHAEILATLVRLFACPLDPRVPGPQSAPGDIRAALTSYVGVEGTDQVARDGVLYRDSQVRLTDISDGTSCTLLAGERPPPPDFRYGWWYRGWGQQQDGSAEMLLGVRELNVTEPACPRGPYAFRGGRFEGKCDLFHFWSPHSGGANFAFADGSVRFLRYEVDSIMPALATRAGGEVVAVPD